MKNLYKMFVDYGRMGELSSIFVASPEDVAELEASGKEVYFGEVLGKHSEVTVVFEPGDLKLLSDDQDFVAKAVELGVCTGLDPVQIYLDKKRDDEEWEQSRRGVDSDD